MTTRPQLQKILKGILHIEDKANKTTRQLNHGRKHKSESSIENFQILKQQKQLNVRNHHIPINIYTVRRHHLANLIKRKIQQTTVYKKPTLFTEINTG
jgi:hypothetical protein